MEIWFHSKDPEYAWLSNFSRHPFSVGGLKWRTVEHYYQARKFEGTDLVQRIFDASSAMEAKKMAERHSDQIRSDWDEVKDRVMRDALESKFGQNRKLKKLLLETGEAELIHRSSKDTYWGRNEKDGEGLNRLGEMLMEIRGRLT